jgi:hypothetical protein
MVNISVRARAAVIIAAPTERAGTPQTSKSQIEPGEKSRFHKYLMFSVMNIITGASLRITQSTMQDGKLVTGRTESSSVMPLIAGVFTAFAARIDLK